MRNNFFRIILLTSTMIVVGCDSIPFTNNTPDYKSASRGKPLEVPPDLTSISTDDTYSVPGGTTYSAYSQDRSVPKVERLLPEIDNVIYERAGSQRWLVVKAPPEKVWPIVREFWTDLGFAIRVENIQTGVMETEWVDASGLTKSPDGYLDKFQGWLDKLSTLDNRQKFRTRIDRGENDQLTEIYMSHRSISEIQNDGKERIYTRYGLVEKDATAQNSRTLEDDKRAIAEDIDAELLRRLMVKLGIAEKQSHSIINNPSQKNRASLDKASDGTMSLMLNDPFDRAWRRTGLALDRIGFLVEDRNRSKGLFYVRYSDVEADAPTEEKKGWLDKLKFWDSDKPEKMAANQYHIRLEPAGEGSKIVVMDQNNQPDASPTGRRILGMLYEQLK